ncbi:hypothetical protein BH09BAC4_BH09BAC4_20350 [soil metagenome]
MSTFFLYYIDVTVLALCFVFTLINTVRMVRKATASVRKVPAFFAVFGATSIATFIGAGHLFEISYHALERLIDKTFVYDFRFYSLILMGVVLLSLGVYMIGQIGAWFRGVPGSQRRIIGVALVIVAVSLPTVVFTPIGYAPPLACVITLLAMPFVIKQKVGSQHAGNVVKSAVHIS